MNNNYVSAQSLSNYKAAMEADKQTQKIIENQKTESSDNSFRLHLDFEHMQINKVSLERHKWAPALEALLSKVELTTIWVTLPYGLPDKQDNKRGKYTPSLFWQPPLLDCGVVVHNLITNHPACFSSVTVVNIQACPSSQEFEFVCHLLELCTSLSVLKLILLVDELPWSTLEWALRGKVITSLSITLCNIGAKQTAERVAQLCQVLAPGTLQTLEVITDVWDLPKGGTDSIFPHFETMTQTFGSFMLTPLDRHHFDLEQFFAALHANSECVSALEHLHLRAQQKAVDTLVLESATDQSNYAKLLHDMLPNLRTIEFDIPNCALANCDVMKWPKLSRSFEKLSKAPLNHPVDVTLTSSHCKIFELFTHITESTHGDMIHKTEEGFNHYLIPSAGKEPVMKFVYKRRLHHAKDFTFVSCYCHVCRSEYQWMKAEVLEMLRTAEIDHPQDPELLRCETNIFSCQFDRLKADLVDEFPTLEITQYKTTWSAKIKADEKEVYCCMSKHNSDRVGTLCVGCGMMPE